MKRASGPKAKADYYFSLIIRSRGACERCGETRYDLLQTSHIFTRHYNNTRCDEDNALCLCASCHARFGGNPIEHAEFVKALYGDARYEALRRKRDEIGPASWSKKRWAEEADRLAARWAEIEGMAA
jgi:hypothetical protein